MAAERPSSPTRFSHRGLGIALTVLGAATMAFALFGLAISWVQELMMRSFPFDQLQSAPGLPGPDDFRGYQRAMRTVWCTHLPIWIAGGIGLVVCGLRLRTLRKWSIAFARLGCALALVALTVYTVDAWIRCLPAAEPLFSKHPFMPAGSFRVFGAASAIGSLLMVGAPFAVLLWGLRARADAGERTGAGPSSSCTPAR